MPLQNKIGPYQDKIAMGSGCRVWPRGAAGLVDSVPQCHYCRLRSNAKCLVRIALSAARFSCSAALSMALALFRVRRRGRYRGVVCCRGRRRASFARCQEVTAAQSNWHSSRWDWSLAVRVSRGRRACSLIVIRYMSSCEDLGRDPWPSNLTVKD